MEETYKQISEIIRIELLKRGFIVDVTCTPTKDNSFKIKTTTFQTTPVLFKQVWIESWNVFVKEKENDKGIKYTDYNISIHVCYEHFDGGRNGCNLFSITLRSFENWSRISILSIF